MSAARGPSDGAAGRTTTDPHAGGTVLTAGPALETAEGVVVLVHGRGAMAQSMLELYDALATPWLSAVAPQAAGNTWYPESFMAPLEANQPYLDSALRRLEALHEELVARGVAGARIALLGFSQGACLALEFVARNPRRYGAVMGLTGGLIGAAAPGGPREYPGSLHGTPVFLGSSDPDPHVPYARVEETAEVLRRMGAQVELRRYAGMGHTINEDELEACHRLLREMVESGKHG